MFEINRALIVVRPKQPFLDWVQAVDYDEGLTLERVRKDPSAFLIPEFEFDDEQAAIIEWCYEDLFESQLESWYTDPAVWPQSRNLEMFLEWFDVEFQSLVFDLIDAPIQTIDYGSDDDAGPGSNGN